MGTLKSISRAAIAMAAGLAVMTAVVPATSVSAQERSRGPLRWVALGDSFSADTFVPRWDARDGCGRSDHDWERQLAGRLNRARSRWVQLTDVTCGAAGIDKGVLGPQPCDLLFGPPDDRGTCAWPARPPQIDALSGHEDIVTVGIGANIDGFGSILTTCMRMGIKPGNPPRPGPGCTGYYEHGKGRQWLEGQFASLTREYAIMMRQIHQRAPHAKVFLLGYPAVVSRPFSQRTCNWGNFKRLGTVRLEADGDLLISLEERLNEAIRQQARRNPRWAAYVDIYQSTWGHGVCAAGTSQWLYGAIDNLVVPRGETKPADPAEYRCAQMNELPPGVPEGEACTFFRPNLRGATNQANQMYAAFRAAGLTPRSVAERIPR